MTDIGPVDLIILSFPGDQPPAGFLKALQDVEQRQDVRILDAFVVTKDAQGTVERTELMDIADLRDIAADIVARRAIGLMGVQDADEIAEVMEAGSTVLALLVENVWARQAAVEVRRAGGRLLATVRIPYEQIVAAEADLADVAASRQP
jgi:uncharacterized membrane protein